MFAGMYLKLIALAIVVAAVLGGIWYVHHLQSEVKDLTTQNVTLSTKLEQQNAAVIAFKEDADKRLAAGQAELTKAQAEAAKNKATARIIYKTKPSTPGDLCKSALDLVNGGAK